MEFGLDIADIKALTEPSKQKTIDADYIIEKFRRVQSIRRRQPFEDSPGISYEKYTDGLKKFIKDNCLAIKDLYSENQAWVLRAVRTFRILLRDTKEPPINEVLDLSLLPRFVACLGSEDPELQFEAAWVLTNIAVGSTVQTRFIIESGAVVGLVRLLWTDSEEVRDQAVWALANIAGDLDLFREHVVSKGAVSGVVHVLRCAGKDSTVLKCLWALENLCDGGQDPYKLILVLPAVQDLLSHKTWEIALSSLRILTILSFYPELVKEIVHNGLLKNIEDWLGKEGDGLHLSIQTIANVAKADGDYFKQKIMDSQITELLLNLIESGDTFTIRQISEIINNLTLGSPRQVQGIAESKLLVLMWEKIREERDDRTQYYIVNAIYNIIIKGGYLQVKHIIQGGIVKDLSSLLAGMNNLIYPITLACLEKLLTFGENEALKNKSVNQVAFELAKYGGLETIELLMSHESEEVYLKAYELIEKFYDEEEKANNVDIEKMYECMSRNHLHSDQFLSKQLSGA